MTFRIQKTIISKYLDLVDQDHTTQEQIAELLATFEHLIKNRVLTTSDIYRQKLEIILSNLSADLDTVKRKRTSKEVKLELSKDLYQIFRNDLGGVDYSKTNLADLDKFENDKDVSINIENVNSEI